MDNLAAAGFGPFKISVVVTRHNVGQLDALAAIADGVRRPAAADPAASLGPRPSTPGTRCTRRRRSSAALPLAGRAPRRADRRLLLPPVGPGRAARRAQPVRGGAGRLPDRPGRRRLRLPLRHRPPVPGRQRARRRAASPRYGASPRCSPRCASRRAPAPAPRAGPSTPARAAAWRPSSSPACRSTGPTPSACTGTARRRWRRWATGPALGPRALQGRPGRHAGPGADARSASVRRPTRPERVELAGATWPAGGGDRRARASGRAAGLARAARAAPARSTPTPASPWRGGGGAGRRAAPASPVAPAVAYGASGEHAGFPGTLVVGHEVLADLLVELVRSARCSFAGVVLVAPTAATRRRCSLGAGALHRRGGRRAWCWRPRAAGGRRARRADRDVAACWPSTRRPCGSSWPSRAAPSRSTSCCPVCAPRGAAGIVQRRAGRPDRCVGRRGRALLDAWSATWRRPCAGRTGPRRVSPVAVVTGAARGIGAATVDALVAAGWQVVAVDRCADDPALDYPLADQGGPRRRWPAVTAPPCARWSGDVRSASDMRAAVDEAVDAVRRPGGRRGRRRRHRRRPAAVGDGRRAVGRALRRQRQRGAPPGCGGRAGAARGRRAPAGPVRGRGVGGGAAGAAPPAAYSASKHAVIGLVRSLAADLAGTGITANAVCPGSTRGPMLDASAAVYGLSSPEEFAAHQLVQRLLEPASRRPSSPGCAGRTRAA